MSETLKNIKSRRSTRMYLQEQIKEDEVQSIIEAGIYAPSANNQQSWHFTVVQNKEIIDRMNSQFKEMAKKSENEYIKKFGFNDNFHVFYNAPTVVLVSGDENNKYAAVDCAAAVENMLIQAESMDIGSCWIGLISYLLNSNEGAEIVELLKIPKGYKEIHAVCLGYRKNNNANAPTRKEGTVNYVR